MTVERMEMLELTETMERLIEAVGALESTVQSASTQVALAANEDHIVEKVVATIEPREAVLERRLVEAEETIAQLRASMQAHSGRKTVVASTMLAKGIAEGVETDLSAVDAALASLSIEQRIAVKAEMLRSGVLR